VLRTGECEDGRSFLSQGALPPADVPVVELVTVLSRVQHGGWTTLSIRQRSPGPPRPDPRRAVGLLHLGLADGAEAGWRRRRPRRTSRRPTRIQFGDGLVGLGVPLVGQEEDSGANRLRRGSHLVYRGYCHLASLCERRRVSTIRGWRTWRLPARHPGPETTE